MIETVSLGFFNNSLRLLVDWVAFFIVEASSHSRIGRLSSTAGISGVEIARVSRIETLSIMVRSVFHVEVHPLRNFSRVISAR